MVQLGKADGIVIIAVDTHHDLTKSTTLFLSSNPSFFTDSLWNRRFPLQRYGSKLDKKLNRVLMKRVNRALRACGTDNRQILP